MVIPDLSKAPDWFHITGSLLNKDFSIWPDSQGPSPAVLSTQADFHACTETRLFQHSHKQDQGLPGRLGLQKEGLQTQQ